MTAIATTASRDNCAACEEPITGAPYYRHRYPVGPAYCERCYRAARVESVRQWYQRYKPDDDLPDPDEIHYVKPRPCEVCGRLVAFLAPKRSSRQGHYCSGKCGREARNAPRRVEHEPKVCEAPDCDNTFTPKRSDAKTCSDRCRQRLRRSRIPVSRRGTTDNRDGAIAVTATNRDGGST